MANLDRAHEVEGGVILDDGAGLFQDNFDPSVAGFGAARGSIFMRNDTGQIYRKTGLADTDWNEMDVVPVQVGLGQWTFDSGIVAPPPDKTFRLNNAVVESATKIFIDYTNDSNDDISVIIKSLSSGDLMFLERPNGSFFIRLSANVDQGTYAEIDISQIESFGSPNTGQKFSLTVSIAGGAGGGGGTRMITFVIQDPTVGDIGRFQHKFATAVTINRVSASTNQGTVTLQFDERAEATPNTAGTDVLTAPLVADSNTEATTAFANAGIAADAILNLDIDAESGSPGIVRIHVDFTEV